MILSDMYYWKGDIKMANLVDKINAKQVRKDIPEFRVGDTVKVNVWVKEGKKERIQAFEGIVIERKGGSVSETFTVRKKSYGIGVERVFPVNAPTIDSIEVVKKGMVRRAKLHYVRGMKKDVKIKERAYSYTNFFRHWIYSCRNNSKICHLIT